ncbi:MAG TPA: hypothetical protein PK639_00605 [Candidatus Woesebacteria bacterium]|nr:hypothetical protein [Candidatus Woesebacteria bacterium]
MNYQEKQPNSDDGSQALKIAEKIFTAPINLAIGAVELGLALAIAIPCVALTLAGFSPAVFGTLAAGKLASDGAHKIISIFE